MSTTARSDPARPGSTVFGLEVHEAIFFPLLVASAESLVTEGVHQVWDWIVLVGLTFIVLTAPVVIRERRRKRARGEREPKRQDWLLTALVGSMTAFFLVPDGEPDESLWPYAILVVVVVSAVALGWREWRRRCAPERAI